MGAASAQGGTDGCGRCFSFNCFAKMAAIVSPHCACSMSMCLAAPPIYLRGGVFIPTCFRAELRPRETHILKSTTPGLQNATLFGDGMPMLK